MVNDAASGRSVKDSYRQQPTSLAKTLINILQAYTKTTTTVSVVWFYDW